MCRHQLAQGIKTQENLHAYPGKIYLPVSLYEQRQEEGLSGTTKKGLMLLTADDGDDEGPDWGSPISLPKGVSVHMTVSA